MSVRQTSRDPLAQATSRRAATTTTTTFATPGRYAFTVPADVSTITITATGASGGSCGFSGGEPSPQPAAAMVGLPPRYLLADDGYGFAIESR